MGISQELDQVCCGGYVAKGRCVIDQFTQLSCEYTPSFEKVIATIKKLKSYKAPELYAILRQQLN